MPPAITDANESILMRIPAREARISTPEIFQNLESSLIKCA